MVQNALCLFAATHRSKKSFDVRSRVVTFIFYLPSFLFILWTNQFQLSIVLSRCSPHHTLDTLSQHHTHQFLLFFQVSYTIYNQVFTYFFKYKKNKFHYNWFKKCKKKSKSWVIILAMSLVFYFFLLLLFFSNYCKNYLSNIHNWSTIKYNNKCYIIYGIKK